VSDAEPEAKTRACPDERPTNGRRREISFPKSSFEAKLAAEFETVDRKRLAEQAFQESGKQAIAAMVAKAAEESAAVAAAAAAKTAARREKAAAAARAAVEAVRAAVEAAAAAEAAVAVRAVAEAVRVRVRVSLHRLRTYPCL